MKRAGNLLERIAEPENLRQAFLKAVRGKRGKVEAIEYAARLDENLRRLRGQILSGALDVGHYHFFTVHEPKERTICAASFPERVLQHALMNVCEPVLERFAISDSYACRTGKGMHRAVRRAQEFARIFPWHLKLDIRKYFDSIPHEPLLRLLERRIKDKAVLRMIAAIVETYSTAPCRGLPIGNLLSQHLANFYLGHLDHWVKETLRGRGYVRYMDDFILWASDKAALQGHLKAVRGFLAAELRLDLKDNVQLNRSARGVPFLGFRVFPRRLALGPHARRRFARKLRGCEKDFEDDRLSEADLQRHAGALLSFVGFADTLQLRRQIVARSKGVA